MASELEVMEGQLFQGDLDMLAIPQLPVKLVDSFGEVDESDIVLEPFLRRSSPEFAYEVGGPILRRFLDIAHDNGYIYPNSLVRSQPTTFTQGAYPTPPHWHFDFVPGVAPKSYDDLQTAIYSNGGLIACSFDTQKHPDDEATWFLGSGTVVLDLTQRNQMREYMPGNNFDPRTSEGQVYWWDPQIREQIATDSELTVVPAQPNDVLEYGSDNLHHVPKMASNGGRRLVMRVNTPTDSTELIQPENRTISADDPNFPNYVFVATGPTTWVRQIC